jgi:hypothetical protein
MQTFRAGAAAPKEVSAQDQALARTSVSWSVGADVLLRTGRSTASQGQVSRVSDHSALMCAGVTDAGFVWLQRRRPAEFD